MGGVWERSFNGRSSRAAGFDLPGEQLDKAIAQCKSRCPEGEQCGCEDQQHFDIGLYMFNVIGR